MKIFLLFLTICFAFANAQFYYDKHRECRGAYKDSLEHATLVNLAKRFHGPILVKKPVEGVKPKKNLKKIPENKIQRTFDVNRDSLRKELWLEVEKNEFVKICVDGPIVAWETSLNSSILNDSCLAFQAPTLIGVETLNVYFPNSDSSHKINLAVGMRYLDFKNEKVLLGYNEYPEDIAATSDYFTNTDPERFVSVTGTYLVDKYPITNCEITQLLWDDIPDTTPKLNPTLKEFANNWISRKKRSIRNENCSTKDSAANTLFLYQIMKYANARSIREGLKPYYHFTTASQSSLSENQYFSISYLDFTDHEDGDIYVLTDTYSDGYRIPYYNEWMMFARGGDKKNEAPWGNYSSATLEKVGIQNQWVNYYLMGMAYMTYLDLYGNMFFWTILIYFQIKTGIPLA